VVGWLKLPGGFRSPQVVNAKSEIRRICIVALQAAGVSIDPNADEHALLIGFLILQERNISPRPRTIHRTPEFDAAFAMLDAKHRQGVTELLRKLSVGDDVNPHLNRRSLQPSQDDDLLTDWGIVHFHLGTAPEANSRFVERTGLLAFAHVKLSDVYFVDIFAHQNFAKPRLIETMLGRFPLLSQEYEIKGFPIIPSAPGITEDQVKAIRNVHANSVVVVDGKQHFPPGGGFTASGVSSKAVHQATGWLVWAEQVTDALAKEGDAVRWKVASRHPGMNPGDLMFSIERHEGRFVLYEKVTRSIVNLTFTPAVAPSVLPRQRGDKPANFGEG
jgi:hypothetical protein